MNNAIAERQKKEKEMLIEQIKKIPIIQIACEKSGVGRTTYYRWRKEDKEFAEAADTALFDGSTLVNDMAESQLLAAIRERNLTAIIFWLKHHHQKYATKVQLDINQPLTEELTPEQAAVVKKALELSGLTQTNPINEVNDQQ